MIALYPRVSTQEQATEGYSIEEQIDRLKKYCEAMGWKEYKVYTDAGYSGGNMNRPALQEMIKDIKAGKVEKVVVYKLDRLSRSQKDTLELIEDIFLANNCEFESMSERFDTSSPYGRAMIGILAVFAQLEREQIKERMSMGREARAKQGYFHGGGVAPIGYDYIDGMLQTNEYEKMQILEIYDLYINGESIKQIEKTFEKKGYKHQHGSWNSKAIRTILSNELYVGRVKFANQIYEGVHEAFIDQATFDKVQKLLKERTEIFAKHNRKHGRNTTYLGGMLYCKHCGGKYCVCLNGHNTKYYSCYSRRKVNRAMIKDPNCKNKTYNMIKLDNIIFDQIKKLAAEPNRIQDIRKENHDDENNKKIQLIQAEIEKLDRKRKRLMELYSEEVYTVDELKAETKPLNEQKEKLAAELETLMSEQSKMSESEAYELVSSFSDILDRGDFKEIRLTIETLIDKIEIDNEDISIFWNFA